ncbi:MAG: helix-turn-helix domain-containing protein [Halothece sp.]
MSEMRHSTSEDNASKSRKKGTEAGNAVQKQQQRKRIGRAIELLKQGLTKAEIAQEIGVSVSCIYKYQELNRVMESERKQLLDECQDLLLQIAHHRHAIKLLIKAKKHLKVITESKPGIKDG